jgi:hypothetical protein
MRIVGDSDTTTPRAVTTWSTGISAIAAMITKTMLVTTQTTPRAERGTVALAMALDGH